MPGWIPKILGHGHLCLVPYLYTSGWFIYRLSQGCPLRQPIVFFQSQFLPITVSPSVTVWEESNINSLLLLIQRCSQRQSSASCLLPPPCVHPIWVLISSISRLWTLPISQWSLISVKGKTRVLQAFLDFHVWLCCEREGNKSINHLICEEDEEEY